MDKILTVACSTYGDRISNILKVYESIDAVKKINFLVIHQVPEGTCLSDESNSVILRLESHPSIDYIKNSSKGLTLSRNIALKKTKTQYMWVMDDDLEFISGAINKVLGSLEDENKNVICNTYESLRPSGLKRVLYPNNRSKVTGKYILRVASFEMVLNVNQLKRHNITFREDMGVGGNIINLGEESVLIADILRAGGDVIHHSISVNIHPEISTGTIVNNQNFFSKGVVIRRVFPNFWMVYYFLRDSNRILRNRTGEFGTISNRIALIISLSKGLLY